MGKCLSCFHVRTTELLPSNRDSLVDSQHIQKIEAEVPTESILQEGSASPNLSKQQAVYNKTLSVMSNGTSRSHLNKSQSSSISSMAKSTRSSYRSRQNETNGIVASISDNKINALFETYRDKDCTEEDCILEEGIEQLCNDLDLSPDDVRILVLAWKLDAQQMCRFSRAEWVDGLKALNVDNIKDIQKKLPELVNKCKENADDFKSLYRFTFRFGLDSNCGQRILPIDMAVILWKLVFSIRVQCEASFILNAWLQFLSQHTHVVRGIPRDTWNMFLTFYDTIGDDLSRYDDTEAWPSLLDDFVDYQTDKSNQNTTEVTNKNKANNELNQTV